MKRASLINLRSLVTIAVFGIIVLFAVGCSSDTEAEGIPSEIRLDYAYYSPTSIVLREFEWAEEAFKEEGIKVEWTLSQGSNKAIEYLNSNSVDFGSTAGAAALIAESNDVPLENVYVYSQPEWTALVTNEGSGIEKIEDLNGKKVAATLGTDPYIFLVRALDSVGMTIDDIELVNLQHADGGNALVNGDVDAWAGLDPHMAKHELESGTELFFRNIDLNTYGFLNVREEFAENHPEYVEKVIELYERARNWVLENPEEAAELLAEEAGISTEVANIQLVERTILDNPVPGETHVEAIIAAGNVLQQAGDLEEEDDVEALANELINPEYAEKVIE
ncbi:ABC-type nitrate/sulfonate/bicarbonate transport systems [Gracilibacillus boraciitolerans JCM 21714]|uniref:Putative aliphatic sulfonates-binding protein n=1 Tax=Gracilibacillus boraciitolerans JCM 21714 TaxID=1298598 RepID=W4VJ32_9BACI|nr:aliphatic sulfonate ABC transporter substrate-binding protein [Gracilibacillus boraciitolerans]GAE92774.1 ABC-type nitrate/sulfonate/bicarbonate transport systems [Gracilibacillus boraciitolerans JCM 21714]